MRRTKEEAMRTRMSIMESALDIFSEKNFANASVSEITSRIGLSKGAFYWHFKNKQDILVKIIEECRYEGCVETADVCNVPPDTIGSLREYLKNTLLRLRNEERWQKLHKLMIRQHEWPEDVRARVVDILQESTQRDINHVESCIVARQKAGRTRKSVSAHKVAVLFVSIFHSLCISQLSGALPDDFLESVDILCDALAKELSAKDAA